MKKWVRIIAVFLSVLLCLPLAGCNALDEMRQQQGIWQDDGTIIWNGSEYKWLNTNELSLNLERDEGYSNAYITRPDVPVLLSASLGEYFEVNNKGVFLNSWSCGLFCRSDSYDAVLARIKKGFTLDKICYEFYQYTNGKSVKKVYTLTPKQMDQILKLHEMLAPIILEDGMYISFDRSVDLYGCSSDDLLTKELFSVKQAGERYYIEDAEGVCLVPSEWNDLFAEIMKLYDELYGW